MKKPHSTKSKRRIITLLEWAEFLSISRHTAKGRIAEYEAEGHTYDPRDIISILRFYSWYLTKWR